MKNMQVDNVDQDQQIKLRKRNVVAAIPEKLSDLAIDVLLKEKV